MKEDYLWDKSGAIDPEIERLENALSMFRYQETEPPALPAKIIPFERKKPRNFFRLIFAFAASAAVVAICFGVWLQISNNRTEVAGDSTERLAPTAVEKASNEISTQTPPDSVVEKPEIFQPFVEPRIIKARKTVQPVARQNKTIARNVEAKKPAVRLTKEEKYAYDQLMLALSITSSKFKMVKDKVDGIEEKTAVRQNAR